MTDYQSVITYSTSSNGFQSVQDTGAVAFSSQTSQVTPQNCVLLFTLQNLSGGLGTLNVSAMGTPVETANWGTPNQVYANSASAPASVCVAGRCVCFIALESSMLILGSDDPMAANSWTYQSGFPSQIDTTQVPGVTSDPNGNIYMVYRDNSSAGNSMSFNRTANAFDPGAWMPTSQPTVSNSVSMVSPSLVYVNGTLIMSYLSPLHNQIAVTTCSNPGASTTSWSPAQILPDITTQVQPLLTPVPDFDGVLLSYLDASNVIQSLISTDFKTWTSVTPPIITGGDSTFPTNSLNYLDYSGDPASIQPYFIFPTVSQNTHPQFPTTAQASVFSI